MSRSSSVLLAVVLVAGLVLAGVRWFTPTADAPDRTDPSIVHRVDLNHAGPAEIAALPGIGAGIGPRTVERIRDQAFCETEEP